MKIKTLAALGAAFSVLASGALAVPAGSAPPAVIPYGSFAPGDLIVGGPGSNQVQDSGQQPVKSNATTVAPTASNDSTQGYAIGSFWLDTATGTFYLATGVATGAAVWSAYTPSTLVTSVTAFGWGSWSVPANATYYVVPGGAGGNQNYEALAPIGGTLSGLQIQVATAPGTGNSDTFTVYAGTPLSMTATSITCAITGSATSCSDTTHSATITAGQAWSVQAVTSASAPSTAASSAGLLFKSTQ